MTGSQLSREAMMELMAYADGELDDDARARVEALLAESEQARQVVAAIESPAIGQWLAASSDERATKGGADGIADAVMLRVAAGAAKVTPLRRGRVLAASAVGVLALAAAGLLWVRATGTRPETLVGRVTAPSVNVEAIEESAGIEVDEVEAPSRDVSVYYLDQSTTAQNAGAKSAANDSVVIWIGDEKHKPGGP